MGSLGWTDIPANVIDIDAIVLGEQVAALVTGGLYCLCQVHIRHKR